MAQNCLNFMQVFFGILAKSYVGASPGGLTPRPRKILDPPLIRYSGQRNDRACVRIVDEVLFCSQEAFIIGLPMMFINVFV